MPVTLTMGFYAVLTRLDVVVILPSRKGVAFFASEGIMTTLRNNLAHDNELFRLVVLLLALHYLLPIQLVWCNEGDSAPRAELGFNGQCLAGSNAGCSTEDHRFATAERPGEGQDVAFSEAGRHNHCLGCSDELIHPQPAVIMGQAQRQLNGDTLGGCLFSFFHPGYRGFSDHSKPIWQKNNCQLRGHHSLFAQATSLII